jgi:TfoX/Sxy family transcriptional regulator of competence genes
LSQSQEAALERASEIADRLGGLGMVSVKRFFSGAAIGIDGVQFAFIINGTLYFRTDEESRPDFEALGAAPFRYGTPTRQVKVSSYYEAPDAIVDETDELRRWAARSHQAALAARKRKARKKRGK